MTKPRPSEEILDYVLDLFGTRAKYSRSLMSEPRLEGVHYINPREEATFEDIDAKLKPLLDRYDFEGLCPSFDLNS